MASSSGPVPSSFSSPFPRRMVFDLDINSINARNTPLSFCSTESELPLSSDRTLRSSSQRCHGVAAENVVNT
jgi:hypothetical protein